MYTCEIYKFGCQNLEAEKRKRKSHNPQWLRIEMEAMGFDSIAYVASTQVLIRAVTCTGVTILGTGFWFSTSTNVLDLFIEGVEGMDELEEFKCDIFTRLGESIMFIIFELACKGELGCESSDIEADKIVCDKSYLFTFVGAATD